MNDVSKDQALLRPFELGDLSLANRVVLAPLTRARAGESREANALMAEYYSQRANAGLVITEATTVSTQGNGWVESPGIYTDAQGRSWEQVVDAVHAKGARIFLQLWHTGRASHSSFQGGERPVAPSAIKIEGDGVHTATGKQDHEVPRALDLTELPGVVADYASAAGRARDAGFDGVEVHAANGYLLDQFLQSNSNHREDAYGGSIENRFRLLREVVEAVSEVFPSNRVGVRLSPNGVFNGMGSSDYRETFAHAARELDQQGLSYLHVLDGLGFGFHELGQPVTLADVRKDFHGPVIGNCGYEQESAEAAVSDGMADLIAIGRAYISNPDLVQRYRNGWPLAELGDSSTWYAGGMGAKGYTDYPTYEGASPV